MNENKHFLRSWYQVFGRLTPIWNQGLKFGPNFSKQGASKMTVTKSVTNISCAPDFIFVNEKRIGWIRIFLDIGN